MKSHLDPQRVAAARALLEVDEGKHLEVQGPLARHVALGVLRLRGALDAVLEEVGRPMGKLDPEVRATLRIGLFELKRSRTPDHAAVDQAVQLVRRLKAGRASGYVNAVLRKSAGIELSDDPLLNHPDWLIERWKGRLGEGTAAWCAELDKPAPLGLAGDFSALVDARPGPVPGTGLLDNAGAVEELPEFDEGTWWVMDPAAAAVADLVPLGRVLDACAAPGGKTLRLLSRGCDVVAIDRSKNRLSRLKQNLKRCGYSIEMHKVDWEAGPVEEPELFDCVLVDAPCTALGTTRRHPEIRWTRQPTDPLAMAIRQERILHNAARHVAPGGTVVYAVCSTEPEEGREVALSLGWPIEQELDTTGHAEMDAHYAARMRRPD
jgi:16S rRNA (cytosine967-C5)-methyltransferase